MYEMILRKAQADNYTKLLTESINSWQVTVGPALLSETTVGYYCTRDREEDVSWPVVSVKSLRRRRCAKPTKWDLLTHKQLAV